MGTLAGCTPLLDYWIATRPMPGQSDCGDQHLIASFPGGVLLAAVDGLGHGEDAALAARAATAVLAAHAGAPVVNLVRQCHAELKGTRGAVMSIVSCNGTDNSMTWIGVGNVDGVVLRADGGRSSLLPRGGIVGDRLPTLLPATLPLHCGDLLFLATDGIHSAFLRDLRYTDHPHELVHRIFIEHARNTDDALLMGARWTNGKMMQAAGAR